MTLLLLFYIAPCASFLIPITKPDGSLDVKSLISHVTFLETTVKDLHKQLTSTQSRLTLAETKLQTTVSELENMRTKLKESDDKIEATEVELNSTRMELMALKKQVTSAFGRTEHRLNATYQDLTSLQTKLSSERNTSLVQLNTLGSRLDHVTRTMQGEKKINVGFEARYSSQQMDIIPNQPIKFDAVRFNRGGGYNATSGIFTAPVSGRYLFWTQVVKVHSHSRFTVAIAKDGINFVSSTTSDSEYAAANAMASAVLSAGQGIYVLTTTNVSQADTKGRWCHFGGTLLFMY